MCQLPATIRHFAVAAFTVLLAYLPGNVHSQDFDAGAFLKIHCVDCHGPDTQEGNFRADTLPVSFDATQRNWPQVVDRWSRVVARLEASEMPPPERPRPPNPDLESQLVWTKIQLAAEAKSRRAGGRVQLRRLNRLEYENSIHDLLAIGSPLRELLPEDDLANGFSNASSALSISRVHIQQYMAAADVALTAALSHKRNAELRTYRFSYCDPMEQRFFGHACNDRMIRTRESDLWFYAEPHVEAPAVLEQFRVLTETTPGWYRIKVTAQARDTAGKSLVYSVWTAYENRRRELLGYFDALPDHPTTIEVKRWFTAGETIIVAPYRINQVRVDAGLSIPEIGKQEAVFVEPIGPALQIAPIEIEGPIHETAAIDPMRLLGNTPSDAKRILARFIAIAFRRPVSDEDVESYWSIASRCIEQGERFEVAMMAACRAVLCSPDFLFLVEEPGMLSSHALACRLSYLLWRTAPDDELRAVADRGELSKPRILHRETERLLNSPRCQAFVNDFLDHWLDLREINATTPDRELFPEYFENILDGTIDGLLHHSVIAETRMFFADLVQHDGKLMQIVDSDYTFMNGRLASHYGLPNVDGAAMRRIDLPPDHHRGGVLTQASVLKVTANGANTSPVLRGRWILENIIGRPVPSPPPDAGSIEPDTRGATTIREQLAKHKSNTSCASCHRSIDPPGFALEPFDPIGQYRQFYRATETGEEVNEKAWQGSEYQPVNYLRGAAVDATGETADGRLFATPQAFKQILADQPDTIARCLAFKLVTFATGHPPESGDLLALDAIVENIKTKNGGLRSLIHEIIQSELFRSK